MNLDESEAAEVFQKLEEKFNRALQLDELGRLRNDAKIRASKQNISYDEFRELVNAAHLTPLDKNDKLSSQKSTASWNPLALKFKKSSDVTQSNQEVEIPHKTSVPKRSHEFLHAWKRTSATDADRFRLMAGVVAVGNFETVASETCLAALGDAVRALLCHEATVEDVVTTVKVLTALSMARRFGLTLQFLGTDDRKDCRRLLDTLKMRLADKTQDLADRDVTEWTLQELEHKFELKADVGDK